MKKLSKLFIIIATLISLNGILNTLPTYAESSASDGLGSCRSFLGMTSWDCGIGNWGGTSIENNNISKNIWIIVANISNDIVVIAAYLILGYVIYGGYLYMSAAGDPGKAASGRKTLTQAFIGLAIVLSAKVIVNSIHIALLGNSGAFSKDCALEECIKPAPLVTNVIQWIIGIAGVVAVIFIIIGAIGYMTSAGDSGKLQKAKNTILYALIGLAIVGLAEVITAFVSNTIKNANTGYINTNNIIAKELTHEK